MFLDIKFDHVQIFLMILSKELFDIFQYKGIQRG